MSQQNDYATPVDRKARSFLPAAIWYLILVGSLLCTRYHSLYFPAFNWDEPAMMAEAWAALHGQALYRDIYQIHPPLQFMIFMPFLSTFPPELAVTAVRLLNLLLVFAGALIVRKFFLRIDEMAANLAAILFILFLGQEWATSSHGEFYSLFPMLVSSYLILCRKDVSFKYAGAVGFLCGIAFFFKQTSIFEGIALWLILILHEEKASKKVVQMAGLATGFGAAIILSFSYAAMHGTVAATADAIFFRNVRLYAGLKNDLVVDAVLNFLQAFARSNGAFYNQLGGMNGVFFGLLFLWSVALLFGESNSKVSKPSIRLYILASLLWFVSVLFAVTLTGRFYKHYLIPMSTPLVLFFTSWFVIAQSRLKKPLILAAILITLCGAGSVFLHNSNQRSEAYAIQKRSQQIASFVRKHTSSSDTIFLIEECYLDIYYLSERKSPNGIYMYLDMDSDHTRDVPAEIKERQEFSANLPKAIVWGNCSDYPADSFFSDIITRRYFLKTKIQGANIYFLK